MGVWATLTLVVSLFSSTSSMNTRRFPYIFMHGHICTSRQAHQRISNFFDCVMAETFINCVNPERKKKKIYVR